MWCTPLQESLCVLGGHATLIAIKQCGVDGGSGVYGRHFLIFLPKKVVSCRKERVKHLLRMGWMNFFSSCAVVSVFGSGGK